MRIKIGIVAVSLLTIFSTGSAIAKGEDIKGLKLGMTREEVAAKFPGGTSKMTVAGIENVYASADEPIEEYNDAGKVSKIMFFFKSKDWISMLSAFKTKYPKIKCTSSEVRNGMGAKFEQMDCAIGDIWLKRYIGDTDTSVISMHDAASLEELRKRREAKEADL